MFPISNSSATIIDCFLREANNFHIKILMNYEVIGIQKFNQWENSTYETVESQDQFMIKSKDNTTINSDYVCIACGGYYKNDQFSWLLKMGHCFESPVPSLFTFNIPANPIVELMGITVADVVVRLIGSKLSQRGALLITHWGLSGPAILKLSAFAARILAERKYDFTITINWLPQFNENSILEKLKMLRDELGSQKIGNRNPFNLPNRLWQYHLQRCSVNEDIRWADLPAKLQNFLAIQLCSQQFHIKGKTTFKEEFVTAGGIKLNEVNAATMESKIVQKLFFAGEILDVDGITGGYNFQHAWTSGWIAANTITSLQK